MYNVEIKAKVNPDGGVKTDIQLRDTHVIDVFEITLNVVYQAAMQNGAQNSDEVLAMMSDVFSLFLQDKGVN